MQWNLIVPFCFMKHLAATLIHYYQKTVSPDHGVFRGRFPHGFCPYYPSCSEYTKLSILKLGILKGLWVGAIRILRCNPFTRPQVHMPH